jgi:hypothetical protein
MEMLYIDDNAEDNNRRRQKRQATVARGGGWRVFRRDPSIDAPLTPTTQV